MATQVAFSAAVLQIDPACETERIQAGIRHIIFSELRRKGAVVALSGGVDSSVTAALCAHALGRGHVLGLMMPESDSSPDSERLARLVADQLGIAVLREDITPILETARCYQRRDEAVRRLIPNFHAGWKWKIALPNLVESDRLPVYSVVAQTPDGAEHRARLTAQASLEIVAATNFKQRVRKMLEYHHADRLQYAVAGTPNLLEYDQGFFVKLGDGAADLKPIAHLYKSQVYQLADYLGIPEEIRKRPPTTDTYSMEQSQEEFYFAVSLATMDLCMYAKDHGIPAEDVAMAVDLSPKQVDRLYRQIETRRRVARYLLCPPVLISSAPADTVPER